MPVNPWEMEVTALYMRRRIEEEVAAARQEAALERPAAETGTFLSRLSLVAGQALIAVGERLSGSAVAGAAPARTTAGRAV